MIHGRMKGSFSVQFWKCKAIDLSIPIRDCPVLIRITWKFTLFNIYDIICVTMVSDDITMIKCDKIREWYNHLYTVRRDILEHLVLHFNILTPFRKFLKYGDLILISWLMWTLSILTYSPMGIATSAASKVTGQLNYQAYFQLCYILLTVLVQSS